MEAKIKLKERKLIHEGTSLRTYVDVMEFGEGQTQDWDYIEHRFNASAIAPVLPNGNILLVRQYRPATGGFTWEIPAGKRDDDGKEDPFDCAKRELTEETGYASENIEHFMTYRPAVAYCSEIVDIYIARDIVKVGEQQLDEAEFIDVKEFSLDELLEMIKRSEIQDGKTVATILYLRQS